MNTSQQFDEAVAICKNIYLKKTMDYGTSWRVLRVISVVDQIYIKALRVRTIQEKQLQMVADGIDGEFVGMVNYGIIGLIQLSLGASMTDELPVETASALYDKYITEVKQVMQAKNHDYGEAWRNLSEHSLTDLILVKLLRIKQILINEGKTLISEGIDANYTDIINYAIFALILIAEGKQK